MKHKYLFTLLFLFLTTGAKAQTIFTVAGDSTRGYNGDTLPAVQCELNDPIGVAVDSAGNIYFSDRDNNRICKVNLSGIMTTIAGTGVAGFSGDGGPATTAEMDWPFGIALDASGNVYFADGNNSRIRKIDVLTGTITTIAGTDTAGYNGDNIEATAARLYGPVGIAIDSIGNIYIADSDNSRVRKINTEGIISTIAGNGIGGFSGDGGVATNAQVDRSYGIAVDNYGNIYFSDYGTERIRKIGNYGIITTIAGNGTAGYNGDDIAATSAELNSPALLSVASNGNIYLSDSYNSRTRIINTSGIIITIAGTGVNIYNGDGILATDANLLPVGVVLDNAGNIYISDFGNDRIRLVKNTLFIPVINPNDNNLKIYPNPSNGDFSAIICSNTNEEAIIIITNELGEKIKEVNTYTNQPTEIQLNAPPGIYFLSAACIDGDWSGRITISP